MPVYWPTSYNDTEPVAAAVLHGDGRLPSWLMIDLGPGATMQDGLFHVASKPNPVLVPAPGQREMPISPWLNRIQAVPSPRTFSASDLVSWRCLRPFSPRGTAHVVSKDPVAR